MFPTYQLNVRILLLVTFFIIGFYIRMQGIDYGLPYILHPDENRQILDTLGMGARKSIIPGEFTYPALHKYILLLVYGFYYTVGRVAGLFSGPEDLAYSFMTDPSNIYLISRFLSVVFGMSICIIAYFIGRDSFDALTGVASFIFTTLMYHLVQHSQWALSDIFLAFFSFVAFYYMFKALREEKNVYLYLSGLFIGLCISTKFQGVLLLPSFFLSIYFYRKTSFSAKSLSYAFLLLTIGVCAGNLAWFFEFDSSLLKFRELSQLSSIGTFATYIPFAKNPLSVMKWFTSEFVRQETVLGLVIILGIMYALYKHTKEDFIFLLFVLVTFVFFSRWGSRYLHHYIILFPILCVFAGRFLVGVLDGDKRKYLYYTALVLVTIPSIYFSVKANAVKAIPDTRITAKNWIEENIPANSKIAIDWRPLAVPLQDNLPIFIDGPVAMEFYNKKVSQNIKDKYTDFLKNKIKYTLVDIVYDTTVPSWSKDMKQEDIAEFQKKEIYVHLYNRFNFKTLSELRAEGIKYLILSSYVYSQFLLDGDPEKTVLFNPYLKENTLYNFHQVDTIEKSSNRFLFYLAKRARNFYVPILTNSFKDVVMLKEFKPNKGTGPIIKLYKIG